MLNLIYDRTQADVDAVSTIKELFKVENSVGSYIQIADLGSGKYLVFEGTQAQLDSYMSGLKGAWNYTDLNRIGNAIRIIKSAFESIGIYINVVGKNDWVMGDCPTVSQANQLISDLNAIRSASMVTQSVPSNLDGITYEMANNIESLLSEAYIMVLANNSNFNHCGNYYCGSEGVLG